MAETQIMLDSDLVRGAPDQDPVVSVLSVVGAFVVRSASAKYRLTRVIVQRSVTPGCVVNVYAADGIPEVGLQVEQIRPDGKGELFQSRSDGQAQFNWGSGSAFTNAGAVPFTVCIVEGASRDEDTKQVRAGGILSDVVRSLGDFEAEHIQVYLQFVEAGAAPAPVKSDLRGVINALAQMHMGMDSLIAELEKLNK